MCLRAWMQKLLEDQDLWADSSPLDFDNWLAEDMTKSRDDGHQGKSSYKLMMAVFGEKSGNEDKMSEPTSLAAWSVTTPPNKKAIPQTKKAQPVRMSRLQKINKVVRTRLLKSSSLR